jgi:hypothetical protein
MNHYRQAYALLLDTLPYISNFRLVTIRNFEIYLANVTYLEQVIVEIMHRIKNCSSQLHCFHWSIWNKVCVIRFRSFHSGEDVHGGLVDCDALHTCRRVQTWRWRQYVPLKRWYAPASPCNATTQKTATDVRTKFFPLLLVIAYICNLFRWQE